VAVLEVCAGSTSLFDGSCIFAVGGGLEDMLVKDSAGAVGVRILGLEIKWRGRGERKRVGGLAAQWLRFRRTLLFNGDNS
jgi:hypothetical protein